MQPRPLKNHAALFGNFHFPATPDTTVKLVQAFSTLGFMPLVMNTNDPVTGLSVQKIALSRGSDTQIQFGHDRIDIILTMPPESAPEPFIADVVSYVAKIEGGSLKFNRIGLIQDFLMEGISRELEDQLRLKLLPHSGTAPNEWMARWVEPRIIGDEKYNVCLEAMTAPGLAMIMNNKIQLVNGVKVMYDVSTSPENGASRFDVSNLGSRLEMMASILSEEKKFLHDQ